MASSLEKYIANLPAPHSAEEQYLYTLVCELAGVTPSKIKGEPYQSPFWRLEKYWKGFTMATKYRMGMPVTPDNDTVGLSALKAEVSAKLLGNKSVELDMLADEVANLLLGDKRVTESMLADAVASRLLASGRITYDMLDETLKAKIDAIK